MKLNTLHEGLSFVKGGMSEARLNKFEQGLEMLEKFKKEGELIQAEFKRMKELLQWGIDDA